jgi:hypothetical protein
MKFPFINNKKKNFYNIKLRDFTGGINDTYVIAGCLEDAVDRAIESLSEYVNKEDLEFVSSLVTGEPKWESER